MSGAQTFFDLDLGSNMSATSGNGTAAIRAFYSQAPSRDWALQRKVWTVIGSAVISWGAIFGCAALFFGH